MNDEQKRLVEQYLPLAYSIAARFRDVEDAKAEAALALCEYADRLEPGRNPAPYFRRVISRRLLDRRRKAARRHRLQPELNRWKMSPAPGPRPSI